MFYVGQLIAIKNNLIYGQKYGTIKYGPYHSKYLGKVLEVYRVSSNDTAYCRYKNAPCDFGTISEEMVDKAQFKKGEYVFIAPTPFVTLDESLYQYCYKKCKILHVTYKDNSFKYTLSIDAGENYWNELTLSKLNYEDESLDQLLEGLNNENQLQRKDSNISVRERVKGSRVHGRLSKASIRSRPLGNPKSVRGK